MAAPPLAPAAGIAARIAGECGVAVSSVQAVLGLLAESATVPFIARYRKERTGGLDEVQIRAIAEKDEYYTALDARRAVILTEIRSQGKLTPELERQIASTGSKTTLEDLYLPFKPRRRTRAGIARERGLEPLAQSILRQPATGSLEAEAARFVSAARGVPDAKAALAGARDIVAETIAERPDVRAYVRGVFEREGVLTCEVTKAKAKERTKFETYYGFRETLRKI